MDFDRALFVQFQMGSCMKRSIFDEQTSKALKKWHMAVKKRRLGKGGKSPTRTLGGSSTPPSPSTVRLGSSSHTLHRFKTTGHSTRSFAYEDHDASDSETGTQSPTLQESASLIVRVDPHVVIDDPHHAEETSPEDNDFSFIKPAPSKET